VNLLQRTARWVREVRSSLANPAQWLVDWFGGGRPTASGVRVDPDTAMRATAVYACVSLLSETLAGLPQGIHRKLERGNEEAKDHPLWSLLHDQPNELMTSFDARVAGMVAKLLRGNAVSRLVRDNSGTIREIIPLHPELVRAKVLRDGRTLTYELNDGAPGNTTLYPGEYWRDIGLTHNGIFGVSALTYAREAVGLALALEEHGARLFSNGARPQGLLRMKGGWPDEGARKRSEDSWKAANGGLANAHGTAVLEGDIEYQPLSMTSRDAQFIEERKFQAIEIARMFRVPPHMIQDLDRGTFSNIEHLDISFVRHSVRPWVIRLEQSAFRDLLLPKERDELFVRLNLNGLLRGDTAARVAYYEAMLDRGAMTPNQVRELEDMNPGPEELDQYRGPLNMAPLVHQVPGAQPATGKNPAKQDPEEDDAE
jgi:HK97 family phage portal protein